MGRKIPARKHHGVRDPIKQNAQRLSLIKDKINNPPEKQDHQQISHKLADFIKLKDQVKSGLGPPKRRWNDNEDKPENYKTKEQYRHNKELPKIKRFPNEDDADYLKRINRITRESIQEAQFEAKYGVEVIRNKLTGEIKLRNRPNDQLAEEMMKKKKKKNESEMKNEKVQLTAEERNKLAKEMVQKKKKEKLANTIDEYKKDEVKFGEVVHAPPHLTTPRLAKKADTVPRPGKKPLLLHSIFEMNSIKDQTNNQSLMPENATIKKLQNTNLKGKRKDLPMATRHMIEEQQKNAMELYRKLKKNKRELAMNG